MDRNRRVQVSARRPIAASAAKIFQVLSDPASHPALDGSGMLRVSPEQPAVGRVGDTFMMSMYLPELGDYMMLNRVTRWPRETPGCRSARPRDKRRDLFQAPASSGPRTAGLAWLARLSVSDAASNTGQNGRSSSWPDAPRLVGPPGHRVNNARRHYFQPVEQRVDPLA
jgi:hypothetical protein